MREQGYKIHVFMCPALFTAGSAVITLPFCRRSDFLPVFLSAALLGLLFAAAVTPLLNYTFNNKSYKNKALKNIFLYAVSLITVSAAIYGAVSAALDYIAFLNKVQLPRTGKVLVTAAVLLLTLMFIISRTSAVLKYGLFMAVLSVLTVIMIFTLSAGMFDIKSVDFDLKLTNGGISAVCGCFFKYFFVTAVPIAFVAITKQKAKVLKVTGAVFCGILIISLCMLQSVFVLGNAVQTYQYPYVTAVSAFSWGSLFTRLDGLVYLFFFACVTVRISICVKTVLLIIKFILDNAAGIKIAKNRR